MEHVWTLATLVKLIDYESTIAIATRVRASVVAGAYQLATTRAPDATPRAHHYRHPLYRQT